MARPGSVKKPPRNRVFQRKRKASHSAALVEAAKPRDPEAARARNAVDIERSVDTLMSKFPTMGYADLAKVWRNAVRRLEGKQSGAAAAAVQAIEHEWARRGAMGGNPGEHFEWPSTDAPGGDGQLSLNSLMKEGMLKYLEYQVGRTNGQSPVVRRAILRRTFEGVLPPVFPASYMSEWSTPKSSSRLHKLADTIASLVRLFKRRRDARFDDAIADWEVDLRFLHDEYYIGRFHFGWPETRV